MGSTITVPFHGTDLVAITTDAGPPLVPLRPLVVGMGLQWSAQLKRVRRNPVLGPAVSMMDTGSDSDAVCIPLDLVSGFLFGVDASRVKEKIRPRVVDFQRECFRVLADACLGPGVRPAAGQAPAAPAPQPTTALPLSEARRMVATCFRVFGPQPARELWFSLDLPRTPSMARAPIVDLFAHAQGRPGGQA